MARGFAASVRRRQFAASSPRGRAAGSSPAAPASSARTSSRRCSRWASRWWASTTRHGAPQQPRGGPRGGRRGGLEAASVRRSRHRRPGRVSAGVRRRRRRAARGGARLGAAVDHRSARDARGERHWLPKHAGRRARRRRLALRLCGLVVHVRRPPGLPKVEDQIGRPLSPYAVTKYLNELYADVFGRSYGFETVGLRYFNVFGPRQDPEGAYAAVIPKWVATMLDSKAIAINGDGETTRDFCYVDNVVQANLLAATVATRPQSGRCTTSRSAAAVAQRSRGGAARPVARGASGARRAAAPLPGLPRRRRAPLAGGHRQGEAPAGLRADARRARGTRRSECRGTRRVRARSRPAAAGRGRLRRGGDRGGPRRSRPRRPGVAAVVGACGPGARGSRRGYGGTRPSARSSPSEPSERTRSPPFSSADRLRRRRRPAGGHDAHVFAPDARHGAIAKRSDYCCRRLEGRHGRAGRSSCVPRSRVASDAAHDLAVVAIEGAPLPGAHRRESSRVREGNTLFFTGFPMARCSARIRRLIGHWSASITRIADPQANSARLDAKTIKGFRQDPSPCSARRHRLPRQQRSPLYDPESGEVLGVINMVLVRRRRSRR